MKAKKKATKLYVLGLLFSLNRVNPSIALIRKERPDWQKGKLNGIGGKIKPMEPASAAMFREFKEETGLQIVGWKQFCILHCPGAKVYVFKAFSDAVFNAVSATDEEVSIHLVEYIDLDKIIYNLRWLISLALDPEKPSVQVKIKDDSNIHLQPKT